MPPGSPLYSEPFEFVPDGSSDANVAELLDTNIPPISGLTSIDATVAEQIALAPTSDLPVAAENAEKRKIDESSCPRCFY